MGDASVNGDMPHSATLEHFTKYPIVQDSIETVKSNPYGQKGIDITNALYGKFVKPFFPYLETPAAYAKPYALKIDEYGNIFLDKVDEKVPVLKSETKEVKETVIGYVNVPAEKAGEIKKWLLDIYSEQYKNCGGDGVLAGGKALITSSLVLTNQALDWLSSLLAAKKQEAKEIAQEAKDATKEKADEAQEKVDN